MIRAASAAALMSMSTHSESAARIQSLFRAYGADTAFLRFYQGDDGIFAAVMDGTAIVEMPCSHGDAADELRLFLAVQSDITQVRGNAAAVEGIDGFAVTSQGQVLEIPAVVPSGETVPLTPRPLYTVLAAAFDTPPPFDSWYVDVSHRMRHGCCRAVGVWQENRPVACAMTVAETERTAVIGGVGTLAAYRGHGYAKACVTSLAAALQQEGKRVLIAPKNEHALAIYTHWGFVPVGDFGEAKEIHR